VKVISKDTNAVNELVDLLRRTFGMADTMDAQQFLKEMSLLPVVRETIAFRRFFGIDSESNNVSADSSFDKAPTIL
jgi:hypothetical protein